MAMGDGISAPQDVPCESPRPNKVFCGYQSLSDAAGYIRIDQVHGAVNIYKAHFSVFDQTLSASAYPSLGFLLNHGNVYRDELYFILVNAIRDTLGQREMDWSTRYDAMARADALEHFYALHPRIENDPQDYGAKYDLAVGLLSLFDDPVAAEAAELILSDCVMHDPDTIAPYYTLLRIHLLGHAQQWSNAYRICLQLHRLDPDRPAFVDVILALLNLAMAKGHGSADWSASARYLDDLTERMPEDGLAHLGQAYLKFWRFTAAHHSLRGWKCMSDLMEGRRHIDRALALLPQRPAVLLLRGLVCTLQNDLPEAETSMLDLIRLTPEYPPAYWHLSLVYRHAGQMGKAVRTLEVQVSMSPHLQDAPGYHFLTVDNATGQHAWCRYWAGHQKDYLSYAEPGKLFDMPHAHDATELMAWRRLHQAVLADHDFIIDLAFTLERLPQPHCFLVESTAPFALEICIDDRGNLFLSLGNGTKWARASRYYACPVHPGRRHALRIVRTGHKFELVMDGRSELEVYVHPEFTVMGDGLIVGGRHMRRSEMPFVIHEAGVRIARYADEPHWPRIKMMTMFYGDLFADMIHHSMLPSLMVEDGVLDLLKDHEVSQIVYCTPNELKRVEDYCRKLERLGIRTEIDCDLMSHWESDIRPILGEAVLDTVANALREQAIILFCPPDHVFGRGLAKLVRSMKNHQYVVCGHPRITLEEGYPHIKTLLSDGVSARRLRNADLVALAMDRYPHHVTRTRTGVGPKELWWTAKDDGAHYTVRFKEPPPVAFYPSRDIIALMAGAPFAPMFETVDHDLVEFMLRSGRLRAVTDSREFFWIEYCSHFRNYPALRNDYWSHAAQTFANLDLRWFKDGA